jgi:hypothetical protein
MAIQIQLRKGTSTEHNSFTGADGEVTVDTTNKTLRVHDGSTVGGIRLATLTGSSVPAAQLPAATTSTQGAVILNNTVTSTDATQALTAAQGKVLKDTLDTAVSSSFGVGQSWQDVSGSRSKNVTYTNITGKPINVAVIVGYSDSDGGLQALVGGVTVGELYGEAPSGSGYWKGTLNFTVPHSSTYRIEGGSNVLRWVELR